MEDWAAFMRWLGHALFGTPRRAITTLVVIVVIALLISHSLRHWLVHEIVDPAIALLIVIGFMLLIYRVAFKGRIGKIKK